MTQLLLWGTGTYACNYIEFIEDIIHEYNIEIIGFCDNDISKRGTEFFGYTIFSSSDLERLRYDKIIICAYPDNTEIIKKQIVEHYNVNIDKVGDLTDVLFIAQRCNRDNVCIKQTRTPQIYDCFTFNNEIEILKIRLKLLAPFVDYFVLVEMNKTHRGNDKELFYLKHIEEFKEYKDKIIHIVPTDIPQYCGKNTKSYMDKYDGDDWTLENFQRNCIKRGLENAEPEDLICISDCDEIINPIYLMEYRNHYNGINRSSWVENLDEIDYALEQRYFYYYFNCTLNHSQNTSVFVKYKNLVEIQHIRLMINDLPTLLNGGWHLTYFGGLKSVYQKTKSIVEGTDVHMDELQFRMNNAIDPYGRVGDAYKMHFIKKEEIDIPFIDELINEYPQFYKEKIND